MTGGTGLLLPRVTGCPAEEKEGFDLLRFPLDLQQGVRQEVDRAECGGGVNYQVATAGELETVGRVVTEKIHTQRAEFVGLAYVDRPPLAIGKELCPAVVPVCPAIITLGRNRCTYGKAGRNPYGTRQTDKICVIIRAVAIKGVAIELTLTFWKSSEEASGSQQRAGPVISGRVA